MLLRALATITAFASDADGTNNAVAYSIHSQSLQEPSSSTPPQEQCFRLLCLGSRDVHLLHHNRPRYEC